MCLDPLPLCSYCTLDMRETSGMHLSLFRIHTQSNTYNSTHIAHTHTQHTHPIGERVYVSDPPPHKVQFHSCSPSPQAAGEPYTNHPKVTAHTPPSLAYPPLPVSVWISQRHLALLVGTSPSYRQSNMVSCSGYSSNIEDSMHQGHH